MSTQTTILVKFFLKEITRFSDSIIDEMISEDTLENSSYIDSLDVVELIMSLENEFGIEISQEDVDCHFTSITSIVKYIDENYSDRSTYQSRLNGL